MVRPDQPGLGLLITVADRDRSIHQLMAMDGRVSLITGGAGHIGQAMAAALAELGSDLVLLDRDAHALAEAATPLIARHGVRVETRVCDLECETELAAVPAWIEQTLGRLDVLINNAAFVGSSELQGWSTPFEEQSLSTWRRALEVNLTAAFALTQGCKRLLEASGHGSVVNVGSIYGVHGPDLSLYAGTAMRNPAAYAASKGGLLQLTRWLATVLAPGIRVNALSPGGVARNQPQPFVERYVARTPLGRMGREEDFKGAITFLATDLSSWVTGQNIMVDGGWGVW
jgi:NAD(P)-dependent dehydrogenase (short-subunit alcohol dehydrogenase family)